MTKEPPESGDAPEDFARAIRLDFGKYKGMTLHEVAQVDMQYIEWLNNEGVAKKRAIPNFLKALSQLRGGIEDTPEHNALQARFLDPAFVRAFFAVAEGEDIEAMLRTALRKAQERRERIVREALEAIDAFLPELRERDAKRRRGSAYGEWEREPHALKVREALLAVAPINLNAPADVMADARLEVPRLIGNRRESIDVEARLSIRWRDAGPLSVIVDRLALSNAQLGEIEPFKAALERSGWHGESVALCGFSARFERGGSELGELVRSVEVKPMVGEDFPTILRDMQRTGVRTLLVGAYVAQKVTRAQFVEAFRRAKIDIVFLEDVEAAQQASA